MTICESCIRNKDCEWNKGNPRHCTLYIDKEETNFDRITASPEALAEFSMRVFKNCAWCLDGGSPEECPFNAFLDCPAESKENMVKWLKEKRE